MNNDEKVPEIRKLPFYTLRDLFDASQSGSTDGLTSHGYISLRGSGFRISDEMFNRLKLNEPATLTYPVIGGLLHKTNLLRSIMEKHARTPILMTLETPGRESDWMRKVFLAVDQVDDRTKYHTIDSLGFLDDTVTAAPSNQGVLTPEARADLVRLINTLGDRTPARGYDFPDATEGAPAIEHRVLASGWKDKRKGGDHEIQRLQEQRRLAPSGRKFRKKRR